MLIDSFRMWLIGQCLKITLRKRKVLHLLNMMEVKIIIQQTATILPLNFSKVMFKVTQYTYTNLNTYFNYLHLVSSTQYAYNY
jgi:hypothetical protein